MNWISQILSMPFNARGCIMRFYMCTKTCYLYRDGCIKCFISKTLPKKWYMSTINEKMLVN